MDTANSDHTDEPICSIERALDVVGDRWSLLILREADMYGVTQFADFRDRLGVASNMLSKRLSELVDAGVLEKHPYREPGSRTRFSYHLTPAGEQLRLVLGALQQWGDENRPRSAGPSSLRRSNERARPVRIAFVDDKGTVVPPGEMSFVPADSLQS